MPNTVWGTLEKRPNILIILTDQQRAIQHFPEGWAETYLPMYTELQRTGVTFVNGMTNTTACSPSRATLFTSTYPSLHGVKKVSEELYLNNMLPTPGKLTTLGQIMQSAGYDVAYKGKWHLNIDFVNSSRARPFDPYQQEVENQTMKTRYFFPGWTSPDFGTEEQPLGTNPVAPGMDSYLTSLGGPYYSKNGSEPSTYAGNDNRIVHGYNGEEYQAESAIEYLESRAKATDGKPFCLIVGFSNPHDIWLYPYSYQVAGYTNYLEEFEKYKKEFNITDNEDFKNFELPASYTESLSTKPSCQQFWLDLFQGGRLASAGGNPALESIKFYAYLHTLPERLTRDLLNALDNPTQDGNKLADNTLVIRLADHGEMGMAHGGMRQKENQCYREAINVPIIFSHPKMKGAGKTSELQVGLIDIVPTLAEIAGVEDLGIAKNDPNPLLPRQQQAVIQGKSFAAELLRFFNEENPKPLPKPLPEPILEKEFSQFLFATDDVCAVGEFTTTSIRAIVEKDWKYAVYYTADYDATNNPNGVASNFEYELYSYNELSGKLEMNNLLHPDPTLPPPPNLPPFIYGERKRLHDALTKLLEKNHAKPQNWAVID